MLQFRPPRRCGRPASPDLRRPCTLIRQRPTACGCGGASPKVGTPSTLTWNPDSLPAMPAVPPSPRSVSRDKPYRGGSRRHEHAASESRLRTRRGTPCSDRRGVSRLRAEPIDRKGRGPATGFHVKRPALLRAPRKPIRSKGVGLRTLLCRKGRRHRRIWPRLPSYAESMFHVKPSRRTGLGART
jgi:hypothetical protein